MNSKSDIELFDVAIEPWVPGAIQKIKKYCAEGANPNLICMGASTTRGPVQKGLTLLTHSIHNGASRAVESLLEGGADPNLKDMLGWTPWMASSTAFDKRERIQTLLKEYGVVTEGGHIGELCSAIFDGDLNTAQAALSSPDDLQVLSTFRVDLIGHQIRNKQIEMLTYLLESGMPYDANQLYSAVRHQYTPAVEVLLAQGIHPDRSGDDETILMLAASLGNMDIVQLLVKAGADVHRYAFDNIEWTAFFMAKKAKHKEVAKWLKSQMSKKFITKQKELAASRNPKFLNLYKNTLSAEGLSTDDIVNVLERWDQRFGIKVKRSDSCSLSLQFEALPENLEAFWSEVIDFCPDIDDDKDAFLHQLETKKSIGLWWD